MQQQQFAGEVGEYMVFPDQAPGQIATLHEEIEAGGLHRMHMREVHIGREALQEGVRLLVLPAHLAGKVQQGLLRQAVGPPAVVLLEVRVKPREDGLRIASKTDIGAGHDTEGALRRYHWGKVIMGHQWSPLLHRS